MTGYKTTQDVHLYISIPLEYEATGAYRPPLTGDLYLDDYGHVQSALVDWPNKRCIILRERKPQHGPWEDAWEWTGEVCYGEDIDGRVAVSGRSNWIPNDYAQAYFNAKPDGIYFILRPKAKPSLAERLRFRAERGESGIALGGLYEFLNALADDIEAREQVIAEVAGELKSIGYLDVVMQRWVDKLEGKE